MEHWSIKFSALLAEDLRQQELCQGSRWYLGEVCTSVSGVRH